MSVRLGISVGRLYVNKKRQILYKVVALATDMTNEREGQDVVVYHQDGHVHTMYCREIGEFLDKFESPGRPDAQTSKETSR